MRAFLEKIDELDGVPADVCKYIGQLPVLFALREPLAVVTCRTCGHEFRARPHVHKGFVLNCPKCGQQMRVNMPKKS